MPRWRYVFLGSEAIHALCNPPRPRHHAHSQYLEMITDQSFFQLDKQGADLESY